MANTSSLTVIENGAIRSYSLEGSTRWDIGRKTKGCVPDISLSSGVVSRRHGRFSCIDGIWFYTDFNSRNGTIYQGRFLEPGLRGRLRPVMLSDGDVFIFGGGREREADHRAAWAVFSSRYYGEDWRSVCTGDRTSICFEDGLGTVTYDKPVPGDSARFERGMGIYMGDKTYLTGDIWLSGM